MTGDGAAGSTTVFTDAELFVVSKSVSVAATEAVFIICPGADGVTTMVTTAVPPLARLPNAQLTGPVPLHAPCVVADETNATPEGKLSVTFTPVACAGPLLVTTIRYDRLTPTCAGLGDADFVRTRSILDGLMTCKVT